MIIGIKFWFDDSVRFGEINTIIFTYFFNNLCRIKYLYVPCPLTSNGKNLISLQTTIYFSQKILFFIHLDLNMFQTKHISEPVTVIILNQSSVP